MTPEWTGIKEDGRRSDMLAFIIGLFTGSFGTFLWALCAAKSKEDNSSESENEK